MAHPCFSCGSECYCHGDIDDVIVSKTPSNCDGCGCDDSDDRGEWDDNDSDFGWCSECDGHDACRDFGCAIKLGHSTQRRSSVADGVELAARSKTEIISCRDRCSFTINVPLHYWQHIVV